MRTSQYSSVKFSHSVMPNSLWFHGLQQARHPCPSPTPRVTQTHVHWVGDAIQPSHPLSSQSPPALSFPASGPFPMSQFIASGGQCIGVSASTSVLPMNIQDWFPLEWTGWISLQCKDSQKSSPTPQFKSINSSLLSFLYHPTPISIHDYWKNHSFNCMNICGQSNVSVFYMLSRLVITFLPRSKRLLISWLMWPSSVILEPKKIKSVTVSIISPSICHEVMGLDAMIFVFVNVEF